jgi:hypothetical protein
MEEALHKLAESMAQMNVASTATQMQMAQLHAGQSQQGAQYTELKETIAQLTAEMTRQRHTINKWPALTASTGGAAPSETMAINTETWGITECTSTAQDNVTREQCADMINTALRTQVAPALGKFAQQVDHRFAVMEDDIKRMKMRTAWLERDMQQIQVEVAKAQVIARNWPAELTTEDRHLSITTVLEKVGVTTDRVTIHTTKFYKDDPTDPTKRIEELSLVTIIQFDNFPNRKLFLDELWDNGRKGAWLQPLKWHSEKTPQLDVEGNPKMDEEGNPKFYTDHKSVLATGKVKVAPGVTQYERRLSAPFHQMMNAYSEAFPQYKGVNLNKKWKTLILTDPHNDAWLGRVKYTRAQRSASSTTAATTDWKCIIMLPEKHFKTIMEQWMKNWYDQLKQQIERTEGEDEAIEEMGAKTKSDYTKVMRFSQCMKKAKPTWDTGTDEGLEVWVARFKWEFPWEVSFESVSEEHMERKSWEELRTVEELMQSMAEDGKTQVATAIPEGTTTAEAADPTGAATKERMKNEKGKRMAEEETKESKHQKGSTGKGKGGSSDDTAPMSE